MPLVKDFDFSSYLHENVNDYKGDHHKVIRLLPGLYKLLSKLLKSDDLPQSSRSEIYLTMGYLFYPEDVYPEDLHGPFGFIDDLMLILVVLRRIKEKMGGDYIEEFWDTSYPLQNLIEEDYIELSNENRNLLDKVLLVTGLADETYLG